MGDGILCERVTVDLGVGRYRLLIVAGYRYVVVSLGIYQLYSKIYYSTTTIVLLLRLSTSTTTFIA